MSVANKVTDVDCAEVGFYDEVNTMSTVHSFAPGDFLIFQLESAYALLRVIDVESSHGDAVWHVAVYRDLFLDPETADAALDEHQRLTLEIPHAALTNRAFESTQVAKMRNIPLTPAEAAPYEAWKSTPERQVFDRSVRLLLGLR